MAERFILASASPRRRELLAQVGAEFEIIPARGEEVITSSQPKEVVLELSAQKAAEVAGHLQREEAVILGADTVVVYEGQILGKPRDEEEAERMLSMLCGNTHSVYTGVTVIRIQDGQTKRYSFYEETKVTMYPMDREQILSYIRTGEPMDKAGAYGIQGKGALFVEKINGDYNNVVGLPVAKVFQVLESNRI